MLFPKFWLKPKDNQSFLKYLLFPATIIWRLLIKLEVSFKVPIKSAVPVICIGNITVGGNGKTPTAMKIRSLLKKLGYNPHILSRGYKASFRGPHLVNPLEDSFLDVGDEPLMMSFYGPTWVARDRRLGIKSAISSGADVIILDDGFQNHSIFKDFSILVIETSVAFGNGYLVPAGPLREPISNALEKADLLITIGERSDQKNFEIDFSHLKLPPSSNAILKPRKNNPSLKNKVVIGFSGIAHPEKFLTTLKHLGANVIRFEAFPNHKPFKIKALKILISEAKKHKAILITTEKDYVRIPKNLKSNFHALTVNLELANQQLLLEKLVKVL